VQRHQFAAFFVRKYDFEGFDAFENFARCLWFEELWGHISHAILNSFQRVLKKMEGWTMISGPLENRKRNRRLCEESSESKYVPAVHMNLMVSHWIPEAIR
jgi:hypothetical protein